MGQDIMNNDGPALRGWGPALMAVLAGAITAGTCGYMSWLLWTISGRALPIEALKASTYALVTLAVAAGAAGGGLAVAVSLLLRSARQYAPEESGLVAGMVFGAVAEVVFARYTGSGAVFGPALAGVLFGGGGAVMSASLFTSLVAISLPARSEPPAAAPAR